MKDIAIPSNKVSTAVVVAALEKRSKSPIAKLKTIDKIKTQADFDLAGEQIKLLKALDKEADQEEDRMVKGIKESLKAIKEHFQPFHSKVDEWETSIKLKMSLFIEAQKKRQDLIEEKFSNGSVSVGTYAKQSANAQIKNGAAKVKKVFQLFIDDPKKIPREYLEPNESAIREAFKAGKKIEGCRWEQVDSIAI